ncbi:MAG: hypothetical protein JNG86_23325 [Verrucomicrobiaceae bacterium]|nr:hypothetical protein [Verrucomicrobiaceae bacterium]
MKRGSLRIAILAAGGAVWLPLCVFGHGLEFLTAKLTLLPEAGVQVEVTADYAGNPLVQDVAAARQAVANPLHVKVEGAWVALDSLAPVSVTEHEDWSGCAPPSLPPPPPEARHALITATWRWQHPAGTIAFTVPKGNIHDVFLWQETDRAGDGAPKWMLLLAGDVTKDFPLLPRRRWMWITGAGTMLLLVLAAVVWRARRHGRGAI